MEKKSKKKKKKFFYNDVFPCSFPFSGDKKGEKSKWFCFFFVRGEGKFEIDYKKKRHFFFSFREPFNYFW